MNEHPLPNKQSQVDDQPLMPYLPTIVREILPPVSPPIKWAGGKTQLLPAMSPLFPKIFGRYHEPFLGGGAVFFYLVPQRGVSAYLSDLNPELINFYRVLCEQTEDFLTEIRILHEAYLQASEPEREKMFYQWRNADRLPTFATWSPLRRAVRFYFLNRTAFNGLYRTNQQGFFNVPWGRYKKPSLYRPQILKDAATILQKFAAKIEISSFEIILEQAQSGDFVYLDPPYAPVSPTASFTTYTKEGFSVEEQKKLAAVCRELDQHGVMFLLSNSNIPWIRSLYQGFAIQTVKARRNINSKGDKRGPISEILIYNYAPEVKNEQ